jgi:hypothetical protein
MKVNRTIVAALVIFFAVLFAAGRVFAFARVATVRRGVFIRSPPLFSLTIVLLSRLCEINIKALCTTVKKR